MKFLHLSDLHLGKRLNEFPMLEDQKYILKQILSIAKNEQADAVIIAGDIYDKPVPPAEAVRIFDWFLTALADLGKQVFAISGNHDSAERLAFGAQLMQGRGVHISPVYNGKTVEIPLSDEYGALSVYLLPFIKPITVRHTLEEDTLEEDNAPERWYAENHDAKKHRAEKQYTENDDAENQYAGNNDAEKQYAENHDAENQQAENNGTENAAECAVPKEIPLNSYQDAVKYVVEHMEINTQKRNLLIAHQFVTGAGRCDSEEVVVGGLDNVDAQVFDAFDYVALGHIHSPQSIGREHVRYCGTPLKYSFSEAGQEKSVTVVEMKEKGKTEYYTVPLRPLHDMRILRGTYLEVTAKSFYQEMDTDDYVKIILTDEEDIPDGMQKLRVIYPNLMRLEYDNRRTRRNQTVEATDDIGEKSDLELFAEFYALQNNQSMSEKQQEYITKLFGEIQGGAAI